MVDDDDKTNPLGLRVIKTARDEVSINEAINAGFMPIIKKVEPSKEIKQKYSVLRNKKTGEIEVIGDFRGHWWWDEDAEFETIIDWTYYYPYSFKSPYAAYLIPNDMVVGERVYIEDMIEDYIGASWNQGDTYRLESCEAIWNGSELEIQYDPKKNCSYFIG